MADTQTNTPDESKGSAFSQVINLFVAPGQALDYAREHPGNWWLPLGIVLALQAVMAVWIALTININAWHQMMAQAMAKANPEHAQQAIQMLSSHGRGYLMVVMLMGLIGTVIAELLYALYLFLADKVFSADSKGYGKWFSFTTWTGLPVALGIMASIIAWGLSSKTGSLEHLDVTNLNSLVFHFHQGSPFYKVAQFSILQFWVIGLVTYGLKRWCRHGTGKALAIALLPYIAVYGILYLI